MGTTAEPETTDQPGEARVPHEMFARTRAEGERRLQPRAFELTMTSLVGGFGVIALAAATAAMTPHFGPQSGAYDDTSVQDFVT